MLDEKQALAPSSNGFEFNRDVSTIVLPVAVEVIVAPELPCGWVR